MGCCVLLTTYRWCVSPVPTERYLLAGIRPGNARSIKTMIFEGTWTTWKANLELSRANMITAEKYSKEIDLTKWIRKKHSLEQLP